jgi:hypothetical protein
MVRRSTIDHRGPRKLAQSANKPNQIAPGTVFSALITVSGKSAML